MAFERRLIYLWSPSGPSDIRNSHECLHCIHWKVHSIKHSRRYLTSFGSEKMRAYWQDVLKSLYGISAELTRLNGEYDLNFFAKGDDGKNHILKVMHVGCDAQLVDMQCKALHQIKKFAPGFPAPFLVPTSGGEVYASVPDAAGVMRHIWVMTALDGVSYADFKPHSLSLIESLGRQIGLLDKALEQFAHPYLERDFKWNLTKAGWIRPKITALTNPSRKALVSDVISDFEALEPELAALPKHAIHNDINDYNILVRGTLTGNHDISGLIDLGDMVAAPRVCEIAIAGAYVALDHGDPKNALAALVAGYHSVHPLSAAEIDMIYPLLRMRLAVSVVNSTLMAEQTPDDPYVTISQAPAWRFLEGQKIDAGLMRARLRCACGFPVTDAAPRIHAFLNAERGNFAPIMGEDLADAPMGPLSVAASTTPQNPFDLSPQEAALVGQEFEDQGRIWLGYYAEPRLIYTADAFRKGPWKASNRRTVHIAVDAFAPAGRSLHAPMEATVAVVENRYMHLDYGGVVILSHKTPGGDLFYTLYGHLNPEVTTTLKIGQTLKKGEAFCKLGTPAQNGGWSPHVHFQLALTTEGMGDDWPGVADPDELYLWQELCPNPAALLNIPDAKTAYQPVEMETVLEKRRVHFGGNLKLSYEKPVMFLRGWRHHLFDEMGRPYLDAYNNVPHVGHAHPRIQAVAADQLKRMNSNTRYLHPAQTEFADKVLSKMPDHLSVCFFVNSGSEANELALRLARAHSGGKDMITPDHGYHGNTTGAIDLSAYKFNKPGGVGQQDWVHLVDVADDYRGRFRRDDPDRAGKYAALVDDALDEIATRGGRLAGFIAETFPSVGGQIIPPAGYLAKVYSKIRAAGGVCIADEVQTGLGRLGDYYFGFEQQCAKPDIIVLGKPIGNGHPIGVVVTTAEIARSFSNGIEYFSTFGGSTLSCRTGKEVLDIVDDEGLQENARLMGGRLLDGLRSLQKKHNLIGDVRGFGLFVGVELVQDRESLAPATDAADYVLNRMRAHRVLIGTEGPYDNILKIRPPLTIEERDVDMILEKLSSCLSELECFSPC